MQDIINSKRVNETLLKNVEEMFDLEYEIKMKAQLKYLEKVEKRNMGKANGIFAKMNHEYLWTPTTAYYVGAVVTFYLLKKKFKF